MNTETLTKFRIRFEEERNNLVYSGRILNEDFQVSRDDLMDETDVTATEMETSMRIRLRNREAIYLKKIEEALAQIKAGSFGLCSECGEEIELRRLEARPTATLCVQCKEDEETRERTHIDGHKHKSLGSKIRLTG